MSNRIREIRKSKGISGPKLAEMLNITPTYLYEMEREKKRLGTEIALQIADIFGVSLDYLLGRSGFEGEPTHNVPDWSTKDIADIKRMIEENQPILFDGVPIEGEKRQRVMDMLSGLLWESKESNKKSQGRKKNTELKGDQE
ncbi:helix-turn-helix domain-containing protein [Paenibacillus sp. UKAQ_18]|nr:helix-turn-helix domain-containing protein [Paenibacillus sp. UKAQ_18]